MSSIASPEDEPTCHEPAIGLTTSDHRSTPPAEPDWGASVFVWGIWASMVLATLILVVKDGSPFPQQDDWEMISALTGNEPITLWWLWRPHGWWHDPGHHDRYTTEHRSPLFNLVYLWLLKLSRADFRSGSVLSVLALGAVAFAMIRTARDLRNRQEYSDAYFPLVMLHWGHKGFLWSQQLYFALSAVVACVMLLLVARRCAPFTLRSAVAFALGLVLLVMSGPGGMAYVPALSLALVASGILRRRAGDPRCRRAGFWMLAISLVVLMLVPLYFVGLEKPINSTYGTNIRDSLKSGTRFLVTGIGPSFFWYTWPYSGMAMIALFAAGTLALCLLWWTRPQERFRAASLLCFMGGAGCLALAMGFGRGTGANYDNHSFLAIPALCCLYLVWTVCRLPLSRDIQVSLFVVVCVALGPNIRYGRDMGATTRSSAERTGRLIQAGIPSAILADLNVMLSFDGFYDQSIARKYAVSRLEMMRNAGFPRFQFLKENQGLAELALPVETSRLTGMSGDNRIMPGSGTGTDLVYGLSEPRFVYAIRLGYRYRGTPHPELKLSWRTTKDDIVSEADVVPHASRVWNETLEGTVVTDGTREGTVAVWVNDTIREIHIRLENKPSTFELSQIVLILPAGDGEARARAAIQRRGTAPDSGARP
jgi:hypothetical protein